MFFTDVLKLHMQNVHWYIHKISIKILSSKLFRMDSANKVFEKYLENINSRKPFRF